MKPFNPGRRFFMAGTAAVTGLLTLPGRGFADSALFPVVETAQGRLRGAHAAGITSFKGIRYGAPTSGANRFMPPQPVEPWAGVKDALYFSPAAPQMPMAI